MATRHLFHGLSLSASGCGVRLYVKALEQTESDVDMQLPGVGDAVKPQQWGAPPGKVPYGVPQWRFWGGGVSNMFEITSMSGFFYVPRIVIRRRAWLSWEDPISLYVLRGGFRGGIGVRIPHAACVRRMSPLLLEQIQQQQQQQYYQHQQQSQYQQHQRQGSYQETTQVVSLGNSGERELTKLAYLFPI